MYQNIIYHRYRSSKT